MADVDEAPPERPRVVSRDNFPARDPAGRPQDTPDDIQTREFVGERFRMIASSDEQVLAYVNARARQGYNLVTVIDGDFAIFAKERPIV